MRKVYSVYESWSPEQFTLKGIRSFLRTDYEMSSIDKDEADRVFKSCKKQYLDSLLKANGFLQYKSNAYVRRNQVDVLEYIDLQKEKNGSRTFTVNYALTPLYLRYAFADFWYSERMGMLVCGKDVWWDYADESIARVSFENVASALEEYVLPWFDAHSNVDSIKKLLLTKERLSVYQQAWLESIENPGDCSGIIAENIKLFGLPKSLGR
ncbi:MAG: DUF4304 domain-containing protein [Bacteroidales bacterium]|nr:DUF4304 domain-containing protein [Bacteroidales bacterium]